MGAKIIVMCCALLVAFSGIAYGSRGIYDPRIIARVNMTRDEFMSFAKDYAKRYKVSIYKLYGPDSYRSTKTRSNIPRRPRQRDEEDTVPAEDSVVLKASELNTASSRQAQFLNSLPVPGTSGSYSYTNTLYMLGKLVNTAVSMSFSPAFTLPSGIGGRPPQAAAVAGPQQLQPAIVSSSPEGIPQEIAPLPVASPEDNETTETEENPLEGENDEAPVVTTPSSTSSVSEGATILVTTEKPAQVSTEHQSKPENVTAVPGKKQSNNKNNYFMYPYNNPYYVVPPYYYHMPRTAAANKN